MRRPSQSLLSRSLGRFPVRKLGGFASWALLSTACGLQTEAPSEEQGGSTHAVISIERSETAGGQNPRAEALAGEVRTIEAPRDKRLVEIIATDFDFSIVSSFTALRIRPASSRSRFRTPASRV